MLQPDAFNPLDYGSLSDSIANALMDAPLTPLSKVGKFEGSGVYALFYEGGFPAYAPLAQRNRASGGSWPIYVGKAAPSTRKGSTEGGADTTSLPSAVFLGTRLYDRIRQHRSSIEYARNLEVEDFSVRLLVLSYIWVPMAETAMIMRYQPLWNAIVDGFGNHAPGSGRSDGVRPRWDTLHPGRPWAARLPARSESAEDIVQDVQQAFEESIKQ